VADEEQRVIEAAEKRMAEIHATKETEATSAADKLMSIKAKTQAAIQQAEAESNRKIKHALEKYSVN